MTVVEETKRIPSYNSILIIFLISQIGYITVTFTFNFFCLKRVKKKNVYMLSTKIRGELHRRKTAARNLQLSLK